MIINNDKEYELEDFLNEEMEYSKMTPSAAVWERISREVKPHYRWGIWALTLLMLFVPYSLVMYYLPVKNNGVASTAKAITNTSGNNTDKGSVALNSAVRNEFNNKNNASAEPAGSLVSDDGIESSKVIQDEQLISDNNGDGQAEKYRGDLSTLHVTSEWLNVLQNAGIEQMKLTAKLNKKTSIHNSIANSIVKNKKTSKYTLEVYATPSVSYRNLSDDKQRLQYYRNIYRNNPFTDNIAAKNVNAVVNEKAGLGKEIGIGIGYNLGSKWKLKAGLQFNERQYSIEAYKAIGIANYAFVKNNMLDSVSESAQYATMGTNKVTLNNSLYQLSMPLGIEWYGFKKNKFSVGVGASVQPTYLLQDNTYVLSTDYQYYSKGDNFSRKWNVNSAIDVSFNYSGKKYSWYFAPQYRYQLLNTYNDLYSIKERRWDLGLKIGIIKTF